MKTKANALRFGHLVTELLVTFDGPLQLGRRSEADGAELLDHIEWEDIECKYVELEKYYEAFLNASPPPRDRTRSPERLAKYFGCLKEAVTEAMEERCTPELFAAFNLGNLLFAAVVVGVPAECADPFLKRLAANMLVIGIPQEYLPALVKPLLSDGFDERAEGAAVIKGYIRERLNNGG